MVLSQFVFPWFLASLSKSIGEGSRGEGTWNFSSNTIKRSRGITERLIEMKPIPFPVFPDWSKLTLSSLSSSQPEAPSASSMRGAVEEDEGDLNKSLGVQRFQQILSSAPRVPDEQHRTYNEEDFECKHTHNCSHNLHTCVGGSHTFAEIVEWITFIFVNRKYKLLIY